MDAGVAITPLVTAAVKDEVVKHKKNVAGDERVFYGGQTGFTIVMRSLFGPIFAWMIEYRHVLPCKVGVNAAGPEWDYLARLLEPREGEHVSDKDYKKYDKKTYATLFAGLFCYYLMVLSGKYSSLQLKRALGLIPALQYYFIDFIGTIVKVLTGTPSGVSGTTQLNSIVEMLYEICAYWIAYALGKPGDDMLTLARECEAKFPFFKNIVLANFGDDNVTRSSKAVVGFYTEANVAAAFEALGMDVTDTAKDGPPRFKNLDQISFLKRSFRFDVDVQMYLAPLEESSIYKMLTWRLRDKISLYEHARIVIHEATRQFFLHGRNRYEEFLKELLGVDPLLYDPPDTFDTLVQVYKESTTKNPFIRYDV